MKRRRVLAGTLTTLEAIFATNPEAVPAQATALVALLRAARGGDQRTPTLDGGHGLDRPHRRKENARHETDAQGPW